METHQQHPNPCISSTSVFVVCLKRAMLFRKLIYFHSWDSSTHDLVCNTISEVHRKTAWHLDGNITRLFSSRNLNLKENSGPKPRKEMHSQVTLLTPVPHLVCRSRTEASEHVSLRFGLCCKHCVWAWTSSIFYRALTTVPGSRSVLLGAAQPPVSLKAQNCTLASHLTVDSLNRGVQTASLQPQSVCRVVLRCVY